MKYIDKNFDFQEFYMNFPKVLNNNKMFIYFTQIMSKKFKQISGNLKKEELNDLISKIDSQDYYI